MTDRELMQQALDALETICGLKSTKLDIPTTMQALRARLAQPEPKREWQGLTDEEIDEAHETTMSFYGFARAIEAKLKEKNGF